MRMVRGSANTVIARTTSEVFAAVADVTRMGEWSPECTGGRWVAPATGPAVGAKFEGDNIAKVGPVTLKRWTTMSEITEYVPHLVFEFVAEGLTTWRYEFEARDGATSVTESFAYEPHGWQKVVYAFARRATSMVKGSQQTLARMKVTLEA